MTRCALSIGINDYPGTDSDLAGCVNDAADWTAALRRRGFEVATLLDRKATGAAIRQGIRDILARSRPGDLALVQYSGHGSFVPDEDGDEPDGTDECLCPHDVTRKGPITDDELFELLSARPAGVKVVMISDSCHSGTVARFAPIRTPPTLSPSRPWPPWGGMLPSGDHGEHGVARPVERRIRQRQLYVKSGQKQARGV